jgi:hypothetical protein
MTRRMERLQDRRLDRLKACPTWLMFDSEHYAAGRLRTGAVCDDGLVAIGSDWVWDGGGAYDLLAGGGGRQRGAEAGAP